MIQLKKEIFSKIKTQICQKIDELNSNSLRQSLKNDGTIVTEIDNYVSKLIKQQLLPLFPNWNFYSEEDFDQLRFPGIILDPIDGTSELVKMIPECAVSLAIMHTNLIGDKKNFAWIFNPFTHEEYLDLSRKNLIIDNIPWKGLISRTEYISGDYSENEILDFNLNVVGSIAYKLAKLANGECSFVISKRGKNIWDIAAGTILCQTQGICMYIKGKPLELLDKESYDGPIIWCRPEHFSRLRSFINEK